MELHDFLEKFLPNYNDKARRYDLEDPSGHGEFLFFLRYFPEALANYTDMICKKQRDMCIDSVNSLQEPDEIDYKESLLIVGLEALLDELLTLIEKENEQSN